MDNNIFGDYQKPEEMENGTRDIEKRISSSDKIKYASAKIDILQKKYDEEDNGRNSAWGSILFGGLIGAYPFLSELEELNKGQIHYFAKTFTDHWFLAPVSSILIIAGGVSLASCYYRMGSYGRQIKKLEKTFLK